MAFERFIPHTTRTERKRAPRVIIRTSGLISFDVAVAKEFGFGDATHAVLFFDKARKMLGVKPTKDAKEEGALTLSRRQRVVSLKATEFFEAFAFSFAKTHHFEATKDRSSGMLSISLKTVQRRRGRRPKQG